MAENKVILTLSNFRDQNIFKTFEESSEDAEESDDRSIKPPNKNENITLNSRSIQHNEKKIKEDDFQDGEIISKSGF